MQPVCVQKYLQFWLSATSVAAMLIDELSAEAQVDALERVCKGLLAQTAVGALFLGLTLSHLFNGLPHESLWHESIHIRNRIDADWFQGVFAVFMSISVACSLLSVLLALQLYTRLALHMTDLNDKVWFVRSNFKIRLPEWCIYGACITLAFALVPNALVTFGTRLGSAMSTILFLALGGFGLFSLFDNASVKAYLSHKDGAGGSHARTARPTGARSADRHEARPMLGAPRKGVGGSGGSGGRSGGPGRGCGRCLSSADSEPEPPPDESDEPSGPPTHYMGYAIDDQGGYVYDEDGNMSLGPGCRYVLPAQRAAACSRAACSRTSRTHQLHSPVAYPRASIARPARVRPLPRPPATSSPNASPHHNLIPPCMPPAKVCHGRRWQLRVGRARRRCH